MQRTLQIVNREPLNQRIFPLNCVNPLPHYTQYGLINH